MSWRIFGSLVLLVCLVGWCLPSKRAVADDFIVVVGAAGETPYGEEFNAWAARWIALGEQSNNQAFAIGMEQQPETETEKGADLTTKNDREVLLETLERWGSSSNEPLWIVLIGHGTFQQGVAKFNLRGPDISANELQQAITSVQRPLVVVNCASASGPFLALGQKPDSAEPTFPRTVVTATRGGDEQNFAYFGKYLADAIDDLSADLDHDGNVSILEAYLKAVDDTIRFYDTEGRLLTENALIEDNGDGMGTPASFFRGVRVVTTAAEDVQPDGQLARRMILTRSTETKELTETQRQRVNELEVEIESLRSRKSEMDVDQYYQALEVLMIELAEIES